MSYEHVFVEQLKNFAMEGDVLLALSGSGHSPSVIRAVEYAKTVGAGRLPLVGAMGASWGRWQI